MQIHKEFGKITPKTGKDAGDWYLDCLAIILLGYALFNRGFAYIGVAPFYLGEIAMLVGIVFWFFNPIVSPSLKTASPWLLLALMFWVALRTVTEISTYGLDSIRDAMVIGYGVFAFIVSGLIFVKPTRLVHLLIRYRQFCYLFLILTPFVRLFVFLMGGEENLPLVPGSYVPIICVRVSTTMIHLATITLFLSSRRISWFLIALLSLNCFLAMASRGGLLAFLAVIAAALILRPAHREIWRLVGLAALGVGLLGVSGLDVQLDPNSAHRSISFETMVEQVQSIVGTSNKGNFDDTKRWRIDWWHDIVDYTFFGDFFLTGKGFGINLAKDDGIPQADLANVPLRSPHNSHLTILARGGVPALLLWCLLNACWAMEMIYGYRRASRRGDITWANVFLFLFGHWLAATVSTTFDVYLEGPMGGIWFWTVFGAGWSTNWLYRHRPLLLSPSARAPVRLRSVSTPRPALGRVRTEPPPPPSVSRCLSS